MVSLKTFILSIFDLYQTFPKTSVEIYGKINTKGMFKLHHKSTLVINMGTECVTFPSEPALLLDIGLERFTFSSKSSIEETSFDEPYVVDSMLFVYEIDDRKYYYVHINNKETVTYRIPSRFNQCHALPSTEPERLFQSPMNLFRKEFLDQAIETVVKAPYLPEEAYFMEVCSLLRKICKVHVE